VSAFLEREGRGLKKSTCMIIHTPGAGRIPLSSLRERGLLKKVGLLRPRLTSGKKGFVKRLKKIRKPDQVWKKKAKKQLRVDWEGGRSDTLFRTSARRCRFLVRSGKIIM